MGKIKRPDFSSIFSGDKTVLKTHLIGFAVLCIACALVFVPTLLYVVHQIKKIPGVSKETLYTHKDFEQELRTAQELIERGSYDQGIDILDLASRHSMNRYFSQEVSASIADVLYDTPTTDQKRKYEDALRFYVLSLTVSIDDDHRAWKNFQIANCHKELGNKENAIALYKDFIERFPDSEYIDSASLSLVSLYLHKNKYSLARSLLKKLMKNTESDDVLSQAVFGLAQSYLQEIKPKPVNE